MNGVLTEQLKPLRSKVQSLSSNQTSNNGPKERKKHNIKRQAEKLLKSNAKSQAKPMRKDWEISPVCNKQSITPLLQGPDGIQSDIDSSSSGRE